MRNHADVTAGKLIRQGSYFTSLVKAADVKDARTHSPQQILRGPVSERREDCVRHGRAERQRVDAEAVVDRAILPQVRLPAAEPAAEHSKRRLRRPRRPKAVLRPLREAVALNGARLPRRVVALVGDRRGRLPTGGGKRTRVSLPGVRRAPQRQVPAWQAAASGCMQPVQSHGAA